MKRHIAEALRRMADRLDPPPPLPPHTSLNRTFRIDPPVISPEAAARIGKLMADVMKARPQLKIPVRPSPPPPPPAARRLK